MTEPARPVAATQKGEDRKSKEEKAVDDDEVEVLLEPPYEH